MKILVIGSGAREHALCWALEHAGGVKQVLCTPGNGGIAREHRRDVKESEIAGLVQLAKDEAVDLVIVGPEGPLVAGIVDELLRAGIDAFGPAKASAQLEGSKIFTKKVCDAAGIPTARWVWTDSYDEAEHTIRHWAGTRVPVVKADGLCAGKGVFVADSKRKAIAAAHDMLVKRTLGDAGSRIIIEDRLVGLECSVMAFCDGESAVLLPPARDYKRAHDGDRGPNTGGMGAYSPLPDVDDKLLADIKARIINPTLHEMMESGMPYHGLLYAGVMLTSSGPQLLEYNVRFGDPETQVVLSRVNHADLLEHMLACSKPGGLSNVGRLTVAPYPAVCVVLASAGYPGKYETGFPITGAVPPSGCSMFHAGTKRSGSYLVTSGGRVMSVVALGTDMEDARKRANSAADRVAFKNKYRRSDIGMGV